MNLNVYVMCVLIVAAWAVIIQSYRYAMHRKKHDADPIDSVAYRLAHSPSKIYWIVPVVFVFIAAFAGVGIAGWVNEGVGVEETSEIKDIEIKDDKVKLEPDKVWEYNDQFISKEDKVFSAGAGVSKDDKGVTSTKWFSTPDECFAAIAAIFSFLSYVVLDYSKRGMKGFMTKLCDTLYYVFVESEKGEDKREDKFLEKAEVEEPKREFR